MTSKQPNGLAALRRMLVNAGCTPEQEEQFIESIGMFSNLLAGLLSANEDTAPNFLTMTLGSSEARYELTFRKADGKTPCDRMSELEAEIVRLRKALAFAKSCIKSGEPWSDEYDAILVLESKFGSMTQRSPRKPR